MKSKIKIEKKEFGWQIEEKIDDAIYITKKSSYKNVATTKWKKLGDIYYYDSVVQNHGEYMYLKKEQIVKIHNNTLLSIKNK